MIGILTRITSAALAKYLLLAVLGWTLLSAKSWMGVIIPILLVALITLGVLYVHTDIARDPTSNYTLKDEVLRKQRRQMIYKHVLFVNLALLALWATILLIINK